MKTLKYIAALCCIALASCTENNLDAVKPEEPSNGGTVLTAVIGADTKTTIGEKSGKDYSILWTAGDKINVNGEESSEAVIGTDAKSAKYSFARVLTAPFSAVYPSSVYKSEGVVTIPSSQSYKAGTFDPSSAVLCAYSGSDASLTFHHLMAYLKLSFGNTAGNTALEKIMKVEVKSNGGEPMSGEFSVNYESGSIAPAEGNESTIITMSCGTAGLDLGNEILVAIPAQKYAKGLVITTFDKVDNKSVYTTAATFDAIAGKVYSMPIKMELYPGTTLKAIKVGSLLWAPVYCGYSAEHPNGLLYQYGRAKGQPYYPAGESSSICVNAPIQNPEDDKFYKGKSDWYSGTALTAWPMSETDAAYVEGKIGNPCPEGWRIPTRAELSNLVNTGFTMASVWKYENSTKWTDAENEKSVVIGGFTLNGSELFFAGVGGRTSGGKSFYRSNEEAYARIWASDRNSTDASKASCLSLQRKKDSENVGLTGPNDLKLRDDYVKAGGISVRCVKNSE